MGKIYTDKNVLDASLERLHYIFNNFEHIYFSISGGKDSSVMVQLADIVAKKLGKQFDVLLIDLEAQYNMTMQHIEDLKQLSSINQFYHVCLELEVGNAVSIFEPKWITWDNMKQDIWVREMPDGVINKDNHDFDFVKPNMTFFDFIELFPKWLATKHNCSVACGVGIRTDESLNRFRAIVTDKKVRFNNLNWTTKVHEDVFNFYPLYDWKTEDIWGATFRLDLKFNQVYELMNKNGLSIHEQRLCQPFGLDQRQGLDQYKAIEPETWEKLVNRVSGANMGALYARTKLIGHLGTCKPNHMCWEEYSVFMIESIGLYCPEIMNHYIDKIQRVLWWYEVNKQVSMSDDEVGHEKANWRRIAKAIEKNDFWFKGLSFGETKRGYKYLEKIKSKYEKIFEIIDTEDKVSKHKWVKEWKGDEQNKIPSNEC